MSTKIKQQRVFALYSYCLAYKWAQTSLNLNAQLADTYDPLLALCALELDTLINNNMEQAVEEFSDALGSCHVHLVCG